MPKKNNPDSLSHLNNRGEAQMVDVSAKQSTLRKAVAEGKIKMSRSTLETIEIGNAPKGDVLGTAKNSGNYGSQTNCQPDSSLSSFTTTKNSSGNY